MCQKCKLNFYQNNLLSNFFSEKCDVKNMENFKDYIKILKILRNISTRNQNFLKLVWTALLSFVEKPMLFSNLTELFEVDELHTSMFEISSNYIGFEKDNESRQKAK